MPMRVPEGEKQKISRRRDRIPDESPLPFLVGVTAAVTS
jgi:hypothetical protein